jgi:hypothetical protein
MAMTEEVRAKADYTVNVLVAVQVIKTGSHTVADVEGVRRY